MELAKAARLARELMNKHGLENIRFKWSRMKKAYGCCHTIRIGGKYAIDYISLSKVLTPLSPDEKVKDTILHEIAHALDALRNNNVGHGHTWKRICREIGADPKASHYIPQVAEAKIANKLYKYAAVCDCPYHQGKVLGHFHRRPKAKVCTRNRHPIRFVQLY